MPDSVDTISLRDDRLVRTGLEAGPARYPIYDAARIAPYCHIVGITGTRRFAAAR